MRKDTVTSRTANLWWFFKRCHDIVDITVGVNSALVACWRFYIHHSYCKCFDLKCTIKNHKQQACADSYALTSLGMRQWIFPEHPNKPEELAPIDVNILWSYPAQTRCCVLRVPRCQGPGQQPLEPTCPPAADS